MALRQHAQISTTGTTPSESNVSPHAQAGVFTFLYADHLGIIALQTNASATANQMYYAIACPERSRRGKVRSYSGSFPTRYQFTGQYIDDTDLTYMKARYYDRRTGQFISPDTLVPDPGQLMDYNRYGYARGNPMKQGKPPLRPTIHLF